MDYLYNFEIYLPLKDKKGCPVDPGKLLAVKDQVVGKFGGLTMTSIFGNPVYDGYWRSPSSKRLTKDKNSIFQVLTPQSADSIDFFTQKKLEWTTYLNYCELLITVHEIQVI